MPTWLPWVAGAIVCILVLLNLGGMLLGGLSLIEWLLPGKNESLPRFLLRRGGQLLGTAILLLGVLIAIEVLLDTKQTLWLRGLVVASGFGVGILGIWIQIRFVELPLRPSTRTPPPPR